MTRRRGFSLFEALLSLFLVSLITGMVAAIVGQYQRLLARNSDDQQHKRGFELLGFISQDVARSTLLERPTQGTPSSSLKLQYQVSGAKRYLIKAGSTSWNPYESDQTVKVEYDFNDSKLWRKTQTGSSDSVKLLMAESVKSFECKRLEGDLISLSITLKTTANSAADEQTQMLARRRCRGAAN